MMRDFDRRGGGDDFDLSDLWSLQGAVLAALGAAIALAVAAAWAVFG